MLLPSEYPPQLLPRVLGCPEVRVQSLPPVWVRPPCLHAAGRVAPVPRAYLAGPAGRGEAKLSREPGRGQYHRAIEEAPLQVLVLPLSAWGPWVGYCPLSGPWFSPLRSKNICLSQGVSCG